MDFQILYTEPALADLEEILLYSWSMFPDTSERFGIALLNHVAILGTFPYIGSPVAGRQSVRQLIHTPILVHYRVVAERKLIEVLHFRHAARIQPGI